VSDLRLHGAKSRGRASQVSSHVISSAAIRPGCPRWLPTT
jgi:hypothetical protein